jgi:DNA-binding winged helix-turn-helix (wHTH) protein
MTPAYGAIHGDSHRGRIIRFGAFEVDLRSRELRKSGVRLKLQHKPFQLLELLLEARGALVTRKEISERLWPGLYVNFERSLNTAVNSLRRILRDSPQSPRFIETRAGLGYRFIASVEVVDPEPLPAGGARAIGDVADSILAVVERRIASGAQANRRTPARGLAASQAHEDYLRGRYFYNQMSEDALRRSLALFHSAIEADPDYAPAHAGLADAYVLYALIGLTAPGDALRRAGESAARALSLDRNLAEAHASVAGVRKLRNWDWAGAESSYRISIDLDAGCVSARRGYAALLTATRRFEEALDQVRSARALDPLSLVTNTELAWSLYVGGDSRAAIEQSWSSLAIDAKFAPAQLTLALAYEQLGDYEESIIEFENAAACSDRHPAALAGLVHALAASGRTSEAGAVFNELDECAQRRRVSPYWQALASDALDRHDHAFELLERGLRERDVWMVWLAVDPRFERLRRRPGFEALAGPLQLRF